MVVTCISLKVSQSYCQFISIEYASYTLRYKILIEHQTYMGRLPAARANRSKKCAGM